VLLVLWPSVEEELIPGRCQQLSYKILVQIAQIARKLIRKKKNRSGSTSVVVVEKRAGKFKELYTVGIGHTDEEVGKLFINLSWLCLAKTAKKINIPEKLKSHNLSVQYGTLLHFSVQNVVQNARCYATSE
jgi:hypothetical protein